MLLREDYPSPLNPLGIKGAGESGITGVGAAIASAIDDAIGMPGAVTQLPVTPQRLKQILNGARVARMRRRDRARPVIADERSAMRGTARRS